MKEINWKVKNKRIDLEKFIEERIKENKDLFTKEEKKIILLNNTLISKLYLIGLLDGKY